MSSLNGSLELKHEFDVDVHSFVAWAEEFLGGQGKSRQPILNLVRAPVELLPDWEAIWIAPYREHLRELSVQLCEAAAARLLEADQHGLALATSLAAVRTDPLRESAHRLIIAIHVAQGDLAEASRRYEALEELLRFEIGIGPSFSLEDLGARPPLGRRARGDTSPQNSSGSIARRCRS